MIFDADICVLIYLHNIYQSRLKVKGHRPKVKVTRENVLWVQSID